MKAPTAATLCAGGPRKGWGTRSRSASLRTVRHSHLWREFGTPEFFSHRRQTSTARATEEDGTASLGQTLRTGRPLVSGLSFHDVSIMCAVSLGTKAAGRNSTTCDPHARAGSSEDPTESTTAHPHSAVLMCDQLRQHDRFRAETLGSSGSDVQTRLHTEQNEVRSVLEIMA